MILIIMDGGIHTLDLEMPGYAADSKVTDRPDMVASSKSVLSAATKRCLSIAL